MKLCLTAIVKNSGSILRDCIRSWKPFVSSYCIADTGSTDDTYSIIEEEFSGVDGYLFRDPFVGFSVNRNKVLQEAEDHFPDTTYYIMIDDSFILQNGEELTPFLIKNPSSYYAFLIKNEESTYISGRVTVKGMRYKYRIHEIIDTSLIPTLIPNSCFIHEQRPTDHVKRTKERTQFDIDQLRLDMKDDPENSRTVFYLARTIFQCSHDDDEAKLLFQKRIIMKDQNTYEIYTSMIYLALIEEQRCELEKRSTEDVCKMYKMIHEAFPYHAEPLFFAALCHYRMLEHDKAIKCLEQAIQIPLQSNIGVKYAIYETHIPKMLASYYFKTRMDECVRLILYYYIVPKKPFDFMYESYIRHIFKVHPKAPSPHSVVSYHSTGKYNSMFSEETLSEFQDFVSSYDIEDLVICDRTDRIPYFPNIKRIHFVIEEDVPKGGMIEAFPMIASIIAQDEHHKEYLLQNVISVTHKELVICKEHFSLFPM
jgi:glycosyltransferase involved in cell wall biosynthesis